MFELTDKVALVTGAGQGMGVGLALSLSSQGATVAVNDLVEIRAQSTCDRLIAAGAKALAVSFDVTDIHAVRDGVSEVEALVGPIDILVNNAGIPPTGKARSKQFRDRTPEDWRPDIDLNLYGSLNCIYATVDAMCERGWGRIIQISSGAGRYGRPYGISIYGASKAGIEGFIRHLAVEVGPYGVTANSLAFGRMSNSPPESDAAMNDLLQTIPVRRLGRPEDAGAYAAFLASDEAGYVTGQTVYLNGGRL